MELTKSEQQLIEAIREMDEVPANVLLWYVSGLEDAQEKARQVGADYRVVQDQKRIDIANAYMRSM